MTNFEKYKDELVEMGYRYGFDAIGITKDNKIDSCRNMDCDECNLFSPPETCYNTLLKWLFKEVKNV